MSLISNIFVDFRHFKLDISHLSLPDQGITAIVGPSGSGKTTFLKVLLGIQKCPTFSWIFDEKDLAKIPIQKRRLGIVFQDSDIFSHKTVEENMRFAGQPRHQSKQELEYLLKKIANTLEITHLLKQKAGYLSGGERQRLAIANALMNCPQVLLLDEPFSSLDEKKHSIARSLIKNLVKDLDIPTVMVTHNIRDIQEMAHLVITLSEGKVT